MSGTERGEDVLYEVTWNGQDDYLPDAALDTIERVVLSRLPSTGFDVKSTQARASSVTATVAFDGISDAFSQERAMDAMFQAATVIRTLHANLVACRSALAAALAEHEGCVPKADYEALRQAAWDALRHLGEDLDGDPTPAACMNLENVLVRSAADFRNQMDEVDADLAALRTEREEAVRLLRLEHGDTIATWPEHVRGTCPTCAFLARTDTGGQEP